MEITEPVGVGRAKLSRRTALRLAFATIPAVAAAALPGVSGLANAAYPRADSTNTGTRSAALTRHDGDIVVTTPGTVIQNLDIYGSVKVRAANVTIRRCRIRGSRGVSGNTGLVDCNHTNVRNALIEDCKLKPDYPSVWLSGVLGKEYTARRCDVYNVVDGFGAYNVTDRSAPTNVTIENNYIHDLSYFARDPNHSNGPTHNDGIQVQGGSRIRILGNTILCSMSASAGDQNYPSRVIGQGILISPSLAPVTNSAIDSNYIDGGKVGIYLVLNGRPSMVFGSMANNRFGRNQFKFNGNSTYQIRIKTGVTFTNSLSSNVWDDNGVGFSVGSTGGIRYDP